MAHAFLGLIYYEEKDGHFSAPGDGEHILFSGGADQDLAIIPRIFSMRPWKKPAPTHLEHTKESLEEELPETSHFHLALPREGERRRKKRIVWTPFGEFTISELWPVLTMPKRLLV